MEEKTPKKVLEEKILDFNPNENGLLHHGIFGLPFGDFESKMILVPVPFEATVSYGSGTALGPKSILDASQQLDLYDPINPDGWKKGITMLDIPTDIYFQNMQIRKKFEQYLDGYTSDSIDENLQKEINQECFDIKNYIKDITSSLIEKDKIVGVVGGDHSVSLGYLEALGDKYKNFGVLHIDAHRDLRDAYEGLEYSHASIFFNALKIQSLSRLIQIGIRDYSEEEVKIANHHKDRVLMFTDYDIRKDLFNGKTWAKKCDEIIKKLPKDVYISFDIDGLAPHLSPNTGTPVLGGFSLDEIVFLLEKVIESGRKIIGFDLCEVAPGKDGQWDGHVGARVLYKLCLLTLKGHK
jgi:agmatinase